MADEDDVAQVVGDYKPGSIKEIRLTCFLTYEQAVIRPGPRLNMVVGPNGSGKSTVLNAICLGLGGDPRLLGRAEDARGFVMHGKQKAVIEIELAPTEEEPDTIHVLRREIDRNKGSERGRGRGASTFYINDEKCNIKDVQQLVSETYNISIDNLCTFLPQDKVGDFSGFDPKQLLLETEKTLKNGVYQSHMDLIRDEKELESGADNVETIQAKLQKLQHENERLEREKDRMEEREKALEQAELLKKKKMWLQFEHLRSQCLELKQAKIDLKKQLKKAMEDKQPLQDKLDQLSTQKKETDDKYKKVDQNTQRFQREMTKQMQKHEKHEEAVEDEILQLNQLDAARNALEKEVEKLQNAVSEREEKFAKFPAKEELESELKQHNDKRKEAHRSYEAAKKEVKSCNDKLRDLQEEYNRCQTKVKKMNDDSARRRDRAFRQHPNLRKTYDWLEQNRTQFRRPVVGPIMCEVTPRSQNAAAYLEQHTPNWVLRAFVVETKEDYDLLYSEIRQKLNIPINIINVQGRSPSNSRFYSESKMNVLKREHGVMGYLDESFTAPTSVKIALEIQCMTHKTLVGTDKTQASVNNKKLLDFLSEPDSSVGQHGPQPCSIFTSDGDRSFKYQQMVSRYSGKVNCRIDDVMGAKLLAPGVSERAKKEAEDNLKETKAKFDEAFPRKEAVESKMQKIESSVQQVSGRAKAAKNALQKALDFEAKLKTQRRKLQDKQNLLHGDDNKEKKEKVKKVMKLQQHSIIALESHAEQREKMIHSTIQSAGLRINKHCLEAAVREAKTNLQEKEKEYVDLEQKAKAANTNYMAMMKKLKEVRAEADEKAPLQDDEGNDLPLKMQLEELEVNTLPEVEAAYDDAMLKANGIDANPDVIRQYEQRKIEIEETKEQLQSLTSEKDGLRHRIKQKRQTWETVLTNSVQDINERFIKYFAEMGFTGEVALCKGNVQENDEESRDFKNWGIEIRVSFRENTKAQVLSDRVQSGGERSVSTIMFLMALQDLMVCPFRCVDEINQGLDERNERLVFKRIVANSTAPPESSPTDHAGQYWLITPKLLPNLTDMEVEGLTVLFVYNGPNNFSSPDEWNIDDLVPAGTSKRAKRAITDEGTEEEENSGNSVPARKPRAKKSRRQAS